jgi:menaquinone-dependent protoporphyrinogen oxidase
VSSARKILVTWGSKMGGTAGIARILGDALESDGTDVTLLPVTAVMDIDGFDAVIIGGAIYANRWHPEARRFVQRNLTELRRRPVWMFSSGPLDESSDRGDLPPIRQVAVLMERVGALGHATFGGRLEPNPQGFTAAAMARKHSGDWRNPECIRRWGAELLRALPSARPGTAIEQPAHSVARLLAHAVTGWALCALAMAGLLAGLGTTAALVLHAIAAPAIFAAVAAGYFRTRGARDPLPTALTFAGVTLLLDLAVVAGMVQRSTALAGSIAGLWLPLVLVFLATWATGSLIEMLPGPGPGRPDAHSARPGYSA